MLFTVAKDAEEQKKLLNVFKLCI